MLRTMKDEYMRYYNLERGHGGINGVTPHQNSSITNQTQFHLRVIAGKAMSWSVLASDYCLDSNSLPTPRKSLVNSSSKRT